MNTAERSIGEKVSDMEIALFYMTHIDNPCVDSQTGQNIRAFYIREAKKVLPRFTNPFAREVLEHKITEYENNQLNGGL